MLPGKRCRAHQKFPHIVVVIGARRFTAGLEGIRP
jgi:hypothetical protein